MQIKIALQCKIQLLLIAKIYYFIIVYNDYTMLYSSILYHFKEERADYQCPQYKHDAAAAAAAANGAAL